MHGPRSSWWSARRLVASLLVWCALCALLLSCEAIGEAVGGKQSWLRDVGGGIDDAVRPIAGPLWPVLALLGTVAAGAIVRRKRRKKREARERAASKGKR